MADYFVDPSLGTDTGSGTLGDPWGHTGNEFQKALDNVTAGSTGDNFHALSSGTVSFSGTNLDFSTYGNPTANAPVTFSGYTSSAFDGGMATIDLGGASTLVPTATDGVHLQDLDISGGTGAYQVYADTFITLFRCKLDGGGVSGGVRIDSGCVIGCEITNLGGIGIWGANAIENYVVQGSSNIAIRASENATTNKGNLIVLSSTGATGIYSAADNGLVVGNSIYSSVANTSAGIRVIGNADTSSIINNYVEGISGTGGNAYQVDSGSIVAVLANNRWFNCTTGISVSGRAIYSTNNSVTTASGFTNAGSADYTPTSELKGEGFPSGFLNLAGNAQEVDIGAIQAVCSGGGSASGVRNPFVGPIG